MSAISLILLAAASLAIALGGAALLLLRGLHRELADLGGRVDAAVTARATAETVSATTTVPAARPAPVDEIRTAVAEALAEERERELAEARAFWAAQEAQDGDTSLLAGHGTEYEVSPEADRALLEALLEGRLDGTEGLGEHGGELFVPRQSAPEEALSDAFADHPEEALDELHGFTGHDGLSGTAPDFDDSGADAAELAAARRRHPSHPDFTLSGEPVGPSPVPAAGTPTLAEHERTVRRLTELADARTPLMDVRPGPLGTLDIYAFEDGTTMCMSPGHRETAGRLSDALDAGLTPMLLGGSSVSGAYSLTFEIGEDRIYLLADRVIASL
ncbi:hypothetical protein N566_20235 [Streptomycetaceae bacterium MP113-05]|nr:hypothetical protein N566_20235 [Streptomycetaceae bacterium MP113-05]